MAFSRIGRRSSQEGVAGRCGRHPAFVWKGDRRLRSDFRMYPMARDVAGGFSEVYPAPRPLRS
ncbi:hypothetical protein SBA2_980002 [Acidobacteriia bacterium SbA2]|nr:hypothetical protein SBA2_980002 [Acidobacteriia bacterium SbA2]